MRFITFKTLEGKNFLSFGDKQQKISLKPGVNAIIGINQDKEDSKNGAGKSTITELLHYALYGTTLRDISKDFIQNSITKKRCEVSLEFDITSNNTTDHYKITRKLNPTKCLLFKNGEDITRSTLAKTNSHIQDLIHTPSTVFQNSVIMTVNTALPFMALSKTDKRKFIESVLGLEVFTAMLLKARDEYSNSKRDYEVAYTKLEQIKNELTFNENQHNNYESYKQERLAKLSEKKLNLEKDIEKLKLELTQLDINQKDITKVEKTIIEQNKLITSKQNILNDIQAKLHKVIAEQDVEKGQIKKLLTNKDLCPTCKRNYSDEHKQHVEQSVNKHQENISLLKQAITTLETKQKTIQKEYKDLLEDNKRQEIEKKTLQEKFNRAGEKQISINHLSNNLKEVVEEHQQVTKEQNNELKGKVADLKKQTEENQELVNKHNNQLNVLETVKFVLSEEGIKSFIVKKILKILNSRLAYYLKKLEGNCLCQFNEFFDEEIVDENSQPKSYFNFSGGERKRIDLACLFAFADIRRLQGDVNFSTVFYDELLDSSLDDRGVLLTLKVLRERFQENNESCYIITHRGPEVLSKAEHVISVIKHNGLSTASS